MMAARLLFPARSPNLDMLTFTIYCWTKTPFPPPSIDYVNTLYPFSAPSAPLRENLLPG
jgi:hypothetical protein